MRILFTLFCLLLFGAPALLAQPTEKELTRHRREVARSQRNHDAIISLDTLFEEGVPFALVRRKSKHEPSYQLVTLQEEPLFWVEMQQNVPQLPGGPPTDSWRVYTFVIGDETETAALPLFSNVTEKDMAREIMRHELIDEKGLVPAKVKVFIERYRKTLPEPAAAPKYTPPAYVLPVRDRTKPVYRKSKSTIAQDNATIALVFVKRNSSKQMSAQLYNSEGRRYTTFMYLPDAHNILEFETLTDGRRHRIEVSPEADPVLEVSAYLVAKGYL